MIAKPHGREMLAMRCADCAHWVTHRCRDRNQGSRHNRFESTTADAAGAPMAGECDRIRAPASRMDAVSGEGLAADLFTAPDFGCVEFDAAPAGWDHHRFHRRADHPDGRPNWIIDDTAHAEARF